MKQTTKIALAVAAGAAALLLKKKHSVDGVGKVLENDFYGARSTTKDGSKMVSFSASDYGISVDAFMYYPENMNYHSDWDYWFHIGDYTTLKGAIRGAIREMGKMGYEFNAKDFEKL